MIVDKQMIDFLQDINNSISALIDIVQTFIKLYLENENNECERNK